MKRKKEQGFRRKIIYGLIMTFFYAVGTLYFLLYVIVVGIRICLYLPEALVAFIVAVFRDRWQMWLSPELEGIADELWYITECFGDRAKEYAP